MFAPGLPDPAVSASWLKTDLSPVWEDIISVDKTPDLVAFPSGF